MWAMVERYHHGDLRAVLLAAAMAEVEAVGHADLSMRVLAQRLGVSVAAPYRHFTDRDALLRAVAAEGFVAMGTAAREAMAQAHLLPAVERPRVGARSFLQFARTRPNLFLLMFGTAFLTSRDDPPAALSAPATAAFEQMRARVAAACPGASARSPIGRPCTASPRCVPRGGCGASCRRG